MKLYVKNMVCNRCVISVKLILEKLHISYNEVILGEIDTKNDISELQRGNLINELESMGFELMDTRKNILIEKVKMAVQDYLNLTEELMERKENLSEFISKKLHYEYSYLSDLFSSVEGTTIENYYIRLRIERAKELLVYDEKSLSEIAFQLGFSSVHHLSAQFKKVSGLTPSYFKKLGTSRRKGRETV